MLDRIMNGNFIFGLIVGFLIAIVIILVILDLILFREASNKD